MSIVALWLLVLFETGLLILLLRALGELRQKRPLAVDQGESTETWGLDVGEEAPPFTAIDQNGHLIRLEDSRGRWCILAFISPGCSACAGTIDALSNFMLDEQNIAVLVVGEPNDELNRIYTIEHDVRVPVLTPALNLSDLYQIQGVPFVFVLNEKGIVRAKGTVNGSEHLENLLRVASAPLSNHHERLLRRRAVKR